MDDGRRDVQKSAAARVVGRRPSVVPSPWTSAVRLMALLVVLLISGAATAHAQDSYRELALQEPRPRFYHEAFAWPGGDSTGLAVAFRIPNTQLVFEQTPDGFAAEAEVVVRVRRDGNEVARRTWRATHRETSFEATQDRLRDVQGVVYFALPPGQYTYALEGGERTRLRTRSRQEVVLGDFGGTSAGEAVMLQRADGEVASVEAALVGVGGDVSFAQSAHALVPLTLPTGINSEDATLRWRLLKRPDGRRRGQEDESAPVEGQEIAAGTVRGAQFVALPALGQVRHEDGRLQWRQPDDPVGHGALIDLGGERLPDGAYALVTALEAADETVRTVTHFGTHWREQPLALYHPEVAIEVLQFIVDREVVRRLADGSRGEQAEKLRAFWAERDPTPATPFNELMAEYYRRVDHAAHAYRTGVMPGPDGLATDRARIYVTMGPPQEVVRRLPDRGGVEETWIYADGRRFAFRAATSYDAYRLVE